MTDLFDNPMGLDGFEFVEFASPTAGVLEPVFEMLGFTAVAEHRSKKVRFSVRVRSISFSTRNRTATQAISRKSTDRVSAAWLSG